MSNRITLSQLALPLSLAVLLGCSDNSGPSEPAGAVPEPPVAAELAVGSHTWAAQANMPTARFALATAVVNNTSGQPILYAIGGTAGTWSLAKVEAYNLITNSWSTRAPLPRALRSTNGAAPIGGKIYVSGGLSAGSTDVRTELYRYDPALNTWTQRRAMPVAMAHGVSGVIGGKLYVHGIAGGVARLLRYDPVTDTWDQSLPASPERHQSGAGGVINGKFYLAGGAPNTGSVHVFDPATRTWSAKAPMPGGGRLLVAGAVLSNRLYVIGGQAGNGTILSRVQAYHPASNTWSTEPSLPTARMSLSAARVELNEEVRIAAVGGSAPAALKANEIFAPAVCTQSISLLPGAFSLATQATSCSVRLEQAGEYLAIPFFAEERLPPILSDGTNLPRTPASLHLTGGAAPQPALARRVRPVQARVPTLQAPTPNLPGVVWRAPDFFLPERLSPRPGVAAAACPVPGLGDPLVIGTQRFTSGPFAGYYRDLGGAPETWRVARVTAEAIVVVDSAFYLRLPSSASARAALTSLTEAFRTSVLPTMARFGIARIDKDGDGRTLLLVPDTPVPTNAYAGGWAFPTCPFNASEGMVVPTSRFQSSSVNAGSMADGVSTMMHEMFHLYEGGARPAESAWYASEGNARLAEHVWRVASSGGGSPYTARRTTLPIGIYAGVPQLGITPDYAGKHCVDPTLEGFDYIRIWGNLRAYDTGCWFLGRLAAKLEARGVAENMIFPSLLAITNQASMAEMWNEVTGESRTPVAWRARWLAGMALESNGVSPRDASLRDPMWQLAPVIQGSAYAYEARFTLAPTLDAGTTSTAWEIIDRSVQAARLRVLAGGKVELHNGSGSFFGTGSAIKLLLVRLH